MAFMPLLQLERPDKSYLSCGDGILWAPPFPRWLDRPGFWDEAQVYNHPFQPLFSVALVDARGNAHSLHLKHRRWRPDRLVRQWLSPTVSAPPTVRGLVRYRMVLRGCTSISVSGPVAC